MQRRFPRSLDSLEKIFDFVEAFFQTQSIDESHSLAVNLIIEELFTNMIKYSKESTEDVSIELDTGKEGLVITLTDFDVEPFDITQTKEVDIDRPLEERTPGGLGIHLVKKMTDSISYEYKDRQSKITLIKRLETNGV